MTALHVPPPTPPQRPASREISTFGHGDGAIIVDWSVDAKLPDTDKRDDMDF